MENELNSPQFINEVLSGMHAMPEVRKSKLNLIYSFRTLIYGRKWLMYLLLTLIPIAFSLLSTDSYLGFDTANEAFVDSGLDTLLFFLFAFGALLISLPHTADEISDNVMESYVVRPTRRESIFLARSVVSMTGIWVINSVIVIVYFVYFHLIKGFDADEFTKGLDLLFGMLFLVFLASLIYGSLFTFVGVIGNRGFTFGILLAMLETFFLNLLFLQNSAYIPRTHMQVLADKYLGDFYSYTSVKNIEVLDSFLYIFGFVVIVNLIGIYYFKNRQFEG